MRKLRGKMLFRLSLLSCLSPYLKKLVLRFKFPLVPSAPSSVLSLPLFILAGERAGGERKIIAFRETPAQFFFKQESQVCFLETKLIKVDTGSIT